jgi:hypothetical protein
VIKTLGKVLTHPVTMVNFSLFGMLLVIQVVHTKAHLTLETDVHGHAYRVLKKNPKIATSSCYKMGFSK